MNFNYVNCIINLSMFCGKTNGKSEITYQCFIPYCQKCHISVNQNSFIQKNSIIFSD